jgi:hypothetical protein
MLTCFALFFVQCGADVEANNSFDNTLGQQSTLIHAAHGKLFLQVKKGRKQRDEREALAG